jgi:hypothetical protein
MKSNKKLLVAAVAGALTAATAVPALALENEFHGTFSSFYDLSNYSAAGNDGFEQGGTQNATGLAKNAPTENYFVQRARLNYNAKASDNVKLVTKFELDYTFWGNSSYTTGRNQGGALGADSVQIETKNVYLDLDYPAINAKIGMMPYNDSFKGVLFDADMAGVLLSHNYKDASVAAGFFRFGDHGATLGKNSYDMISLDAKYGVSKHLKVGGAYYYINDNRSNGAGTTTVTPDRTPIGVDINGNPVYPVGTTFATTTIPSFDNGVKVHTVGVNAEGEIGRLVLNGFGMFQFGHISDNQGSNLTNMSRTHDAHGYAFNVGAKLPVFGGTARSEFLYVSGGSDNFFNPASAGGTEGGGFYDAEMIMLNRDKNAKTIDTALVYDANNYNQGIIMGSAGFDYPFSDRLAASANAGFAAVSHDKNTNPRGGSDYLGTELNGEVNYKLTPNVTLGARGGYVFLGDYFKKVDAGKDADNIYDMKIIANYVF